MIDDTQDQVDNTPKRARSVGGVVERKDAAGAMHAGRIMERRINRRPMDRDLKNALTAKRGVYNPSSWQDRGFSIPKAIKDRMEEAGYMLMFVLMENTALKMRQAQGWRPVTLAEVPEWGVCALPSISAADTAYREYCICIDQLLHKIPIDAWEELHEQMDHIRAKDQELIDGSLEQSRRRARNLPLEPLNIPVSSYHD